MSTLVVFESYWGNTETVARAVADGIGGPVEVVGVADAPTPLPRDVDLLVVGGPTHAFGMTRATTRRDAVKQGGRPGHEETGIVSHGHVGRVVGTESFYVEDTPGPLLDGEVERARAWGGTLRT